ncbi:MAG: replication protein [Parcubacteria group bacterium]|jgi:hypothetical protein
MSKIIPNSTQIPNIILDFLLPNIPEAEGKCLLYICRRTFGFHKKSDRISFTQFVKGIKSRDGKILDLGTGLSRQSVGIALKNLINSKAIFANKDGNINAYKLNLEMIISEVVKKIDQSRKLTISGQKNRLKQVSLFDPQKKGKKREIETLNLKGGQPVDNSKNNERKRKVLADMRTDLIKRKIIH